MRTMQNIPFLLPIPATTYSSSVWMAWGTLNQISKTRTPYMHKRVQSWPQVKTQNPLQRFLNWNPILEKKMEEQKKSCMTNDSASPFKVSSKLAPSSFQAQRLAPWTRQNQLNIFSLRGAQGQSPWVQYVGTSNCRGNTASELGFESHGLRSNILPWKIPCQHVVNKTTCQQYSKKNAKQQIAITDSELQLLPHEDFSMKTHHKADTKDPALTNHNQPTLIPTSMFQVHLCTLRITSRSSAKPQKIWKGKYTS